MRQHHPALALTDDQLQIVMVAASSLPVEKRCLFLERIAARLRLIGIARFNDTELDDAVHVALRGLLQAPAA
jgi:hypothetical protein